MEYKECRTCGDILELSKDNYYFKLNSKGRYIFASPDCKRCCAERDRIERHKKKMDDTGSEKILSKPNKYVDNIQKKQTFSFLTLMGWKFNEEKGIWYDDIKKTKDGEFIGVWTSKTKTPVIPEKDWKPLIFGSTLTTRKKASEDIIQQFLKDFFVYQLTKKEIMDKYGVKESYVTEYVKRYKEQLNGKIPQQITKVRKVNKTGRKPVTNLPEVKIKHKKLRAQYSDEFVKLIQTEYFINCVKLNDLKRMYPNDATFISYIVIKTYTILKTDKK